MARATRRLGRRRMRSGERSDRGGLRVTPKRGPLGQKVLSEVGHRPAAPADEGPIGRSNSTFTSEPVPAGSPRAPIRPMTADSRRVTGRARRGDAPYCS